MHIRGEKQETKTIFIFFWKLPKFRSEESVNQEKRPYVSIEAAYLTVTCEY